MYFGSQHASYKKKRKIKTMIAIPEVVEPMAKTLDCLSPEIFDHYKTENMEMNDQYTYDFLGVRTDIRYHKNWANAGGIQKPMPRTSWEWISLLWAVHTAGDSVTLVECGAGWGPWVGRGYVAARTKGKKDISIIAVEGEPTHHQYMKSHFADNDIPESDSEALLGVVSPKSGISMFPIAPDPQTAWGLRNIKSEARDHEAMLAELNATPSKENPDLYTIPKRPGLYAIQKSYTLEDLIRDKETTDYIHFDIQGSEGEVIESSTDIMNKKVRCIFVGTHSHEIEDQIKNVLSAQNWHQVFDKTMSKRENGSLQDGEQVWVNPRFL